MEFPLSMWKINSNSNSLSVEGWISVQLLLENPWVTVLGGKQISNLADLRFYERLSHVS